MSYQIHTLSADIFRECVCERARARAAFNEQHWATFYAHFSLFYVVCVFFCLVIVCLFGLTTIGRHQMKGSRMPKIMSHAYWQPNFNNIFTTCLPIFIYRDIFALFLFCRWNSQQTIEQERERMKKKKAAAQQRKGWPDRM